MQTRYKVPQVPGLILLVVVYKFQYFFLIAYVFFTLIILTYTILVTFYRSFYEYTSMVADTYQVPTNVERYKSPTEKKQNIVN